MTKPYQIVYEELHAIIRHYLIWLRLGNQDIRLKYRRSLLGPFWITLSMMVTIYSMGFLYGHLFKTPLFAYFPYLAAGIISWSFISTLVLESTNMFIESEGYIRNQESFMSLFSMRLITRNFTVFLHNLIAFLPIVFIFHTPIGIKIMLFIPNIIIISLNALFWGTLLGILGTRYRDFAQIINSLIQVIFFLTPIMWMPTLLPDRYQWLATYNPFYQFSNLIRNPILDKGIEFTGLLEVGLITMIGFFLYAMFINKYKYRIVFWL